MDYLKSLLFTFPLGLLPALGWLWFWLREDRLHPEPKKIIALSFFSGMLIVIAVLFMEKYAYTLLGGGITVTMLIVWAAIEEIMKYLAAFITGISRKCDDEPVDSPIYLITVALGFAALENTMFLINSLGAGGISMITSGGMRFIGSTVLHVVASGTLGIFIAHAFYKSRKHKFLFTLFGLIASIVIHSIFNIILTKSGASTNMIAFYFVWCVVVFMILFFEKVKKIQK